MNSVCYFTSVNALYDLTCVRSKIVCEIIFFQSLKSFLLYWLFSKEAKKFNLIVIS